MTGTALANRSWDMCAGGYPKPSGQSGDKGPTYSARDIPVVSRRPAISLTFALQDSKQGTSSLGIGH